MTYSPLAVKRRHVLGDIYDRCEPIKSIPVYIEDKSEEPVGFVDESMGHFADVFLFHLPEIICKKLSGGQYEYIFEYKYAKQSKHTTKKQRIILSGILLVPATKASMMQKNKQNA